MIDPNHEGSIAPQAELLGISRPAVYYERRPIPQEDLDLMGRIDECIWNGPKTQEMPPPMFTR